MKVVNAVLCFLVKDKRVLLGMKKRGFGVGMWNGIGGKIAKGEGQASRDQRNSRGNRRGSERSRFLIFTGRVRCKK